jgi:hypothetical protein
LREFLIAVDLEAQMIDADLAATCRDGKVDARIVQHPLGIVVFLNGGWRAKEAAIEPHALAEFRDNDMHVKSLHFCLRFSGGEHAHPAEQQFSMRKLTSESMCA